MIVRNEEAVLARCLDSVKDVVDEIIIVDTGSTDTTKQIALQYTENVYDFYWINDFSAARNESFSKATMDYCMWMDADDIFSEGEQRKFLQWKQNATPSSMADVVMMKYATAFADNGQPTFLYYRERLLRRDKGFIWKGRVHEAITPCGTIEHLDIYLEHHSTKTTYSKRNLQIYEEMQSAGEPFSPRDLFYYGRELYYHQQYANAIQILSDFLTKPAAFVENQVEACRIAAYCCYPLNKPTLALEFLLKGLSYRVPSGELCCDIAKHYFDRQQYEEAIFWYQSALHAPQKTENGGFILEQCYGYLPALQLSVCYDRLHNIPNALKYHKLAGNYSDNDTLYLQNDIYFSKFQQTPLF